MSYNMCVLYHFVTYIFHDGNNHIPPRRRLTHPLAVIHRIIHARLKYQIVSGISSVTAGRYYASAIQSTEGWRRICVPVSARACRGVCDEKQDGCSAGPAGQQYVKRNQGSSDETRIIIFLSLSVRVVCVREGVANQNEACPFFFLCLSWHSQQMCNMATIP